MTALAIAVFSLFHVVLGAPVTRADPANELAEKVQGFYEKTTDLTADVNQAYTYNAQHRTLKASGTMQLKKPGMLRWDVTKPYPKEYLVDGKALYVYDSDDNEVVEQQNFSADSLSAAVSFLWGKGKLTRDFVITSATRPDLGPNVLELVPRFEKSFQKLYFAVDAKTGLVEVSEVVDNEGNTNRLAFSNVKTNTGIPDARFHFEIPKGATVTKR